MHGYTQMEKSWEQRGCKNWSKGGTEMLMGLGWGHLQFKEEEAGLALSQGGWQQEHFWGVSALCASPAPLSQEY